MLVSIIKEAKITFLFLNSKKQIIFISTVNCKKNIQTLFSTKKHSETT